MKYRQIKSDMSGNILHNLVYWKNGFVTSQQHDIFQLQVDDDRKRRNSGEANFSHIKGHYIITKSHQDKVHSKNVAHQGPNLSVEQGTF